jgi:hypothetical protein
MTYRLSDKTIGQIAKLLQIALLTGTDIVDNLRTIKLTASGDFLDPDEKYLENFDANLNKMLENIASQVEEQDAEEVD